MGSVSQPPGIFRRAAIAAVALITIPSAAVGVWFKVHKETPTVAQQQEPVFEGKSSSGSGLVCDGFGNCLLSGSLTIYDGAVNQLNVGSGVLIHEGSLELTGSGVLTSTGRAIYSFTPNSPGRITDVKLFLSEVADDNLTTADVKINGTSIFSTLPTIDATETGSFLATTPAVINTSANRYEQYSHITVDTYAPATNPGKNLTSTITVQEE